MHLREHGVGLLARHHHGDVVRLARPDDITQVPDVEPEDVAVQEQHGGERLVLSRRAELLLDREVRQELVDLGLGHVLGVPHLVEPDEALHPHDVGRLGARTVVTRAQARP